MKWLKKQINQELGDLDKRIQHEVSNQISGYWTDQLNKYNRLLDRIDSLYVGTDGDLFIMESHIRW
jgi:hypothetical protein